MISSKQHTIVGFGIAGASLAWELFRRKVAFRIIDPFENSASRVSAGMMNPIVFKRLTKSWMADDFLPSAAKEYLAIEAITGTKLMRHQNIRRLFATEFERDSFRENIQKGLLQPYIRIPESEVSFVNSPFGQGTVNTPGSLDVAGYLDSSAAFFEAQGIAVEKRHFDYGEVNITDTFIFCEGHQLGKNPWFSYLPVRSAHGETLIIRCPDLLVAEVLNRGCFVQPLGDQLFRVGATFNWEEKEPVITQQGRLELEQKLTEVLRLPFTVENQEAGIRATVPDRRPLIGVHPDKENLFVFGGLGAKGVMMAPFLARELTKLILKEGVCLPNADVQRWRKRYDQWKTSKIKIA